MFNFALVLQYALVLSLMATWIGQSILDFFAVSSLLVLLAWRKGQIKSDIVKTVKDNRFPLYMFVAYFVVACLGYVFNARVGAEPFRNLRKFDWILQFCMIYISIGVLEKSFFLKALGKVKYILYLPALYGFSNYITDGKDIITGRISARSIGLLNSATYHAHVGALLLVILLIVLIEKREKILANVLLLGAMFASVLLARTRGAVIALVLTMMGYFFLKNRQFFLKRVFPIIAIALLILVPIYKSQIIDYRLSSDMCRMDLINLHIDIVKQYPLLGIGYRDNMRNLIDFWPPGKSSTCMHIINEGSQAHNQFLNVAATTGLLGLLFFCLFYFYFFYAALKLIRTPNLEEPDRIIIWASLGVIILFTFSSFFEVMFEFGKIRYILVFCWAFIQFYSNKYKAQDNRQ